MTTDIAVLGSGPGGSVTASLCAEAGKSVLMIEEGSYLSLDSAPHFSREEMLTKYRNAGINVALGRTKIAFFEGRCVGGGSEVNRGLYYRTPTYILDKWRAEFGVDDLSPETMMPHFVACEKTAGVEHLSHAPPLFSSRLHDGAAYLGWRAAEVPRLYRYGEDGGRGRKQSMTETFVPRFLRAGGRLIADTRAARIRRSAGKWLIQAVHSPHRGPRRPIEISAEKLFVSCGAVQTPALLRRSGFTRNIGNSLRFHPMLKVVAEFSEDVNHLGDHDPIHQVKEFEPRFGIGCSISKRPMLGVAMAPHAGHFDMVDRKWRNMGLYYIQTSSGRARVRNLPFFDDPLVTIRQQAEDQRRLAEGLKRLAEVLFAAGAVAVYPSINGFPVLRSIGDVARLPDSFAWEDGSLTSVHVFSSCPMGENEALCATDSFGRLREADGLYIADASLLCSPTIVNPQGTVMAIAHRNALHALSNRLR